MGNHPSAKLRPSRSSSGRDRLDRAGVLADPGPVRAELGDGVAVAVYRLVLPGRVDELADQVGQLCSTSKPIQLSSLSN